MLDSPLKEATLPSNPALQPAISTPPSFRDMLNVRNHSVPTQFQPPSALEEDDVSDDDSAPEEFLNNEQCPAILLSKAEKIAMRKPWKHALIIKMFHGKIGYMGLMRKLKRKWSLKGDLTLTDIGFHFYIARFTNVEDYQHVLTQGPWMIDDTISRFENGFSILFLMIVRRKFLRPGFVFLILQSNILTVLFFRKLVQKLGKFSGLIKLRYKRCEGNSHVSVWKLTSPNLS